MKVLFITRKYPPQKGGMENMSYLLTTHYQGEKKILALGKKQIHLVWFYPFSLLYAAFTARKWDVIHLGDMVLCSVGRIAKLFSPRVKVAVSIHGLDLLYSNKIYQLYLKCFARGLDSYICNSTYSEQIAQRFGLSPTCVIPPCPLEKDRFKGQTRDWKAFCQKYALPDDAFVILTTGRLVRRKGVAWFIREVLPELTAPGIYYLVAGMGPMEADIRAAVKETDAGSRVKLLGRVSDADLDELYINSHVFAMPNFIVPGDAEGFGLVSVEAGYAGCTVVASGVEGILDAVKDGVNGILVPQLQPEKFAAAIMDLYNHPEKRQRLNQSAVAYIEQNFTADAVAAQYARAFQKALAAAGADESACEE